MQALSGSPAARTAAVLAAGCDIALHCNGRLDEMAEVAAAAPVLAGESASRARAALARRAQPETLEIAAARADLAKLTGQPAGSLVA
jgi:beta-N-acetylhexosaminidase